ncbi:hypothetical protein D3C85_771860 [compost metagenome]
MSLPELDKSCDDVRITASLRLHGAKLLGGIGVPDQPVGLVDRTKAITEDVEGRQIGAGFDQRRRQRFLFNRQAAKALKQFVVGIASPSGLLQPARRHSEQPIANERLHDLDAAPLTTRDRDSRVPHLTCRLIEHRQP